MWSCSGVLVELVNRLLDTYRVNMSFVTAAIEYLSLKARLRASINAVFPDPTGLLRDHGNVDIRNGVGNNRIASCLQLESLHVD